jgi:single-strand DNA-binding protein
VAHLNQVTLLGRLVKPPSDPKSLTGGSVVTSFRLAVGRSKKNQQTGQWENDPHVLYIDCEAFTSLGGKRDLFGLLVKHVKQGDQILVTGRLAYDEWEDRNGGGKRSKHKIVVDSVELLGGKGGGDGEQSRPQSQPRGGEYDPPTDDVGFGPDPDVPF